MADAAQVDIAHVDITDPDTYEQGIPHATFAAMRRDEPIAQRLYEGRPYWAVTRYEDLVTVTRDPETFSSAKGMTNLWDLPQEAMDARRSIIDTDPPEHVRLRKLGIPAFTGRKVRNYEEATRAIAVELLDEAIAAGAVDIVLSDHLVSGGDDLSPNAYGNTTPLELLPFNSPAAFGLFEYGRKLGDERRADPHDDLVTTLIQAEVDGDHLSDTEYANMFQVLVFAGNETTRTAISNGINAFIENPDQLELLHANPELVEQAVEEIIRFATPVLHMRRTATKDTTLAGVEISKGDKVVIWYASANFDETVFENPLNFDISRPVRPKMVSFGAQGPHNCLGAPLARLEIRILLEEIVRRGVRFTATGSIVRTRSNFVNGVASLPARLVTPA